ncbi:MAG: nuclear transport factor 2 family protein [Steroidobacteraceae bacterium]
MTEANTAAMQRLLDKQAITEVLHRYARGVDRCDRSMLEIAYWPDAIDDHIIFKASGDELLDNICASIQNMRTAHRITNILIEFDSEAQARCESYVWAYHNMSVEDGREDIVFGGRYLDRFEKRSGEWRIAERRVVMDYFQRQPAAQDLGVFGSLEINGGHYPSDPSYTLHKRSLHA